MRLLAVRLTDEQEILLKRELRRDNSSTIIIIINTACEQNIFSITILNSHNRTMIDLVLAKVLEKVVYQDIFIKTLRYIDKSDIYVTNVKSNIKIIAFTAKPQK